LDVYRKVLEVVEEGRAEVGGKKHLDGFRRYAELTDAIERLLEDTRSLAHWRTIL
jgi:DNA replication initiation complex subunit (GINS family)